MSSESTGSNASPDTVGQHRHEHCRDDSIRTCGPVQVTRLDFSDRTLASLSVGIAMLAVGLTFLAIVLSQMAERETKLLREDVRVMSIALGAHGINTDEHALEKGDTK